MSKKKVDNIEELFELIKINTEPEYLSKRYNQENIVRKVFNDKIILFSLDGKEQILFDIFNGYIGCKIRTFQYMAFDCTIMALNIEKDISIIIKDISSLLSYFYNKDRSGINATTSKPEYDHLIIDDFRNYLNKSEINSESFTIQFSCDYVPKIGDRFEVIERAHKTKNIWKRFLQDITLDFYEAPWEYKVKPIN